MIPNPLLAPLENECAICLIDMTYGVQDIVTMQCCKNKMHIMCYMECMNVKHVCPFCRKNVVYFEPDETCGASEATEADILTIINTTNVHDHIILIPTYTGTNGTNGTNGNADIATNAANAANAADVDECYFKCNLYMVAIVILMTVLISCSLAYTQ